ncbi:MAG: hypothetical protein RLZZ366_140 [Pseudomonadota bacterium]|jgi:hypothetical protein
MMNRYLSRLIIGSVLLAALVLAFTRLVNPYGYWSGPTSAGINDAKPFANQHLIPVKHAQYGRVPYTTVLIGNSRTEVGLDPQSRAWPAAMQPVYNFGMPGMGLPTSVDAMIQAAAGHKPKTIILGVEYLDFRVTEDDWRDAAGAQPMVDQSYRTPTADLTSMLFSLDAVRESAFALFEARKAHPATTTPQGYNGLNDYHDIVAAEGYAAIFDQRNREYVGRFQTQNKRLAWPSVGANRNWQALSRLVAFCRENRIALTLHTFPYHADLLMIFDRTRVMGELEQWRAELRRYAQAKDVPLYDFIGLDARTSELVPAPGDKTSKMTYYWEAGHFRAALGDMLIGTMVRGSPLTDDAPDLTTALKAYEQSHPEVLARIDKLVHTARP